MVKSLNIWSTTNSNLLIECEGKEGSRMTPRFWAWALGWLMTTFALGEGGEGRFVETIY